MNFTPTDLRISTHTAICNINSLVNLSIIAKYLNINQHIKYIEFGDKIKKGINRKHQSKKFKEKKKVFFNQITFIISPKPNVFNNVKLFNNGAISMTGLKALDEGKMSIKILLDNMRDLKGTYFYDISKLNLNKEDHFKCYFCEKNVSINNINRTACDHIICKLCSEDSQIEECKLCNKSLIENGVLYPNICKIKDYKIVLINSDYYIGFEIKRNKLHDILVNKYNIFSSYEPCIYPGINSKFYWNEAYKDYPFIGKCYCDTYCSGKGSGNGNGDCKKITIAIFQSGSIIITGARSQEQIDSAHTFINGVINEHYDDIKNDTNQLLNIDGSFVEKRKVIKLKINSIKNYPKLDINSN